MTIATFQALCNSLCERTRSTPEELTQTDEGMLAFSVEFKNVSFNILYFPDIHPDSTCLLADFGPVPAERKGDALELLMESNFAMLGEKSAPAFSIHPVFHTVTLQATYALNQVTADDLLRAFEGLADMALKWRQDHFLSPMPAPRDASMDVQAFA